MQNMTENMIEKMDSKDIVPIFSGYEECKRRHSFGPFVRDYYLIHFCLKGKGELTDKFGCHKVMAGEAFIIRPGELTTYVADSEEPWAYSWIAFHGDAAKIFNTDRSVYSVPMEIGADICRFSLEGINAPSLFISLIYKLIYHLFGEKRGECALVERVSQYIDFNYMNNTVSVAGLSAYFGYERSYLYRIFKAAYGIGIKEYILKKRMESAAVLLGRGYSVQRTAFAVGYSDQLNFSKAFKKYFSVSPKEKRIKPNP